ncbi:MAG TPA: NUDIX hydrolase [Candidatus Adamsella sp.]|nr:NUDIX hydrolase [Candidatus Adamsella sp.]
MNRNTKILCSTKYLELKEAVAPNGKSAWIYAHRQIATDVVVIVPVLKSETEEKILFLKTQRPPLYAENKADINIELPAGLVGDERKGESIEQAIEAELREETGLRADSIKIVSRKIASSAGCTSETSTIALAEITDTTEISKPLSDGGIILERIWVNANDIRNWLQEQEKNGCAISAQALCGLFYYFSDTTATSHLNTK